MTGSCSDCIRLLLNYPVGTILCSGTVVAVRVQKYNGWAVTDSWDTELMNSYELARVLRHDFRVLREGTDGVLC